MYFIKLKDGHEYNFVKYKKKKIKTEVTKEGVEILVIEIQNKPRQRYKTVRIIPKTIRTTDLSILREMMIGID